MSFFTRGSAEGAPEGFSVQFVNGLNEDLKVVSVTCGSMGKWGFGTIEAASGVGHFSTASFYPRFDEEVNDHEDASVTFSIGDTPMTFKLLALMCDPVDIPGRERGGLGLWVDWGNVDRTKIAVFPDGFVGYCKEATLDIVLVPLAQHGPQPLADVKHPLRNWMEINAGVIGNLTWLEMTLPSSHQSASYRTKLFYNIKAKTQDYPLHKQLDIGIRVLDFNVAFKGNEWIFAVGNLELWYTLEKAVQEVIDFVNSTEKEIVMIDLHSVRFFDDDVPEKTALIDFVTKLLKDNALKYDPLNGVDLSTSLNDLWKGSAKGKNRIMVAWNEDLLGTEKMDWMWPGVCQKEFKDAENPYDLHRSLVSWNSMCEDDEHDGNQVHHLQGKSAERRLLSLGLFTSRHRSPPENLSEELGGVVDNWLHGSDNISLQSNIISMDFISAFNNLINSCIIANMIKGNQKIVGSPLVRLNSCTARAPLWNIIPKVQPESTQLRKNLSRLDSHTIFELAWAS